MKKNTGKTVGINQRVPFDVLDRGIIRLLRTGIVEHKDIKQDLSEYTKGKVRLSKATGYAFAILTRPLPLLKAISLMSEEKYLQIPLEERKVLIISLFAATYPVAYELLVALAKGFKTQTQINRHFMQSKLGAIYGSNRTLDIAIDALIPMLIELGTIQRSKVSLYEIAPSHLILTPLITESYIYTDIFLSGSKSILVEDLQTRPWYSYYPVEYVPTIHKRLLKFSEGRIGGGYISI
jgi:hypothetical protein